MANFISARFVFDDHISLMFISLNLNGINQEICYSAYKPVPEQLENASS